MNLPNFWPKKSIRRLIFHISLPFLDYYLSIIHVFLHLQESPTQQSLPPKLADRGAEAHQNTYSSPTVILAFTAKKSSPQR